MRLSSMRGHQSAPQLGLPRVTAPSEFGLEGNEAFVLMEPAIAEEKVAGDVSPQEETQAFRMPPPDALPRITPSQWAEPWDFGFLEIWPRDQGSAGIVEALNNISPSRVPRDILV